MSKLFCDYLRSAVGVHMIDNKDHTQEFRWSLSTVVEGTWRVGQKILFLVNGCGGRDKGTANTQRGYCTF